MLKLEKKVALITGGSSGIGKVIAGKFAEQGADLYLCARNKDKLKAAEKDLLTKYDVKVKTFSADVSDLSSIQSMYDDFTSIYDGLDILVNGAGVHKPSKFQDYTYDEFDKVIKTNLYSAVFVTQKFIGLMIEKNKGKIINISSTAGKWGTKNQCAYNISKHALNGFTMCLALEMAPYNINVNAVCPWRVETELSETSLIEHAEIRGISVDQLKQEYLKAVPMKKFLQPEDVANLTLYLASEESNMMTGQAITISGGYLFI
jgi:meso-butanediol dehydrogenase / (S,S)-butanediol dehydrogenase / diacetyl reductase